MHIEGIDKANNPGDVRLVTDGKTTWMQGPGTDNECLQFPNNQGLDPTLVYPETLIPIKDLNDQLGFSGEEDWLGRTAQRFSRVGISIGNWKDAQVNVLQDKASQVLVRLALKASGEDVIFGTGNGAIEVNYSITDINPVTIQPIDGCQIDVPLPESAQKYVRLPGMASFETSAGSDAMIQYFQNTLPTQNWSEKEPLAQDGTVTILSYNRDAESIEVHIESVDGGSKVKIIWVEPRP